MLRLVLIILSLLWLADASRGSAETTPARLALVIGIDTYENIAPLQKARNDAEAVARALARSGFEVVTLLDVNRRELNMQLALFVDRLNKGDEAVFYFAGHGIEIEGRNHLLPADIPAVEPAQQAFLASESLAVDHVLDLIRARGTRVSLLILDACRDNPFPRQGTRSVGALRGLARLEPPAGAFIMFSAGIGQAALDRLSDQDDDPNSVFTRRLLPLLDVPGLPIHEVARRVRIDVMDLAQTVGHDQRPAYYDEITGDFTFLAAVERPEVTDPCDAARVAWNTIARIDTRTAVESFLELHGDCAETRALAEARLAALSGTQVEDGAIAAWALVRETSDPDLLDRFSEMHPDSQFAPEARTRAQVIRTALAATRALDGAANVPSGEELRATEAEAARALLYAPPDPPAIGTVFRDCADCPELVQVLGTEVLFGAPESYRVAQRDERPSVRLALERPFAVAATETTQAEFAAFLEATGYDWPDACLQHLPVDDLPVVTQRAQAAPTGADLPVVCVSWEDAQAYIAWLSERSGKSYRLLHEVEFEYLAEAFYFNTPLEQVIAGRDLCQWVNIADRASNFSWRDFSCAQELGHGILPVRGLQPDQFGLYHLLGNVWEWSQDCYAETPEDTVLGQHDNADCPRRSFRGGSWTDPVGTLRSSNRNWDSPDYRADNLGFRVARTLDQAEFSRR
jgi:formylglycine-generating enzyme required for sulfatase activity